MAWSMIGRISAQGVQFIIGIILARILSPEEYGTIGLLIVFIAFMQVFVDSGFGKALIQKQDRTQIDLSTVFFFNIGISLISYFLLWLSAPFIADFYGNIALKNLLRVLSISLFTSAMFSVHQTIFTIKLDFKTIAKINLITTSLSGLIGVLLAYIGYGVWALVFQILIKSIFSAILMWLYIDWKPMFFFSKSSIKSMFPYGSRLLLSSLLNMSVNNFSNLFIAKFTSIKNLGYYSRGTQFADIIFTLFSSVLDSVLLPSLSKIQNERKRLVLLTKSTIKSAALISFPVLIGLAVVSQPLVKILLGDKWLMSVPIMQILCLARLITIISVININVLYVIGRTDLALRQQYLKIIVRILLLVIALNFGILYVALAELFSTMIHFFINTYYPGKILQYGPFQQIKNLSKILFSSLVMAFGMYLSIYFLDGIHMKLIISLIISLPIYILFIKAFKVEEFTILLSKFKYLIRS